MSKQFIKKNIKLSLEFDRYVSHHGDALAKIPNGAMVFITVKGDEAFNRSSKDMTLKVGSASKKVIEARKMGKRWIIRPVAVSTA